MKFFQKKEKQVSEKDLIKGCIAGERAMQRLLYERYSTTMHKTCLRYASTTFEAEDLLHEAFMKVFTQLHTFKEECPLDAWIRRIVVNTAVTNYRKQSRRKELGQMEQLDTIAERKIPIEDESPEHVLELVQRLPEKYRLVLNLYAIEGYSHKEISEMLNQPEATTRSQYMRARQSLQQMIIKETN